MKIKLGLKTDPIETRYSFNWLFDILADEGVPYVQLGSFYELYWLDDSFFADLRESAESRGLRIKSVFTAHRELGGFFIEDPRMVRAARRGFERLIEVGAIVGADYVGSNPGAVHRDQAAYKEQGTATYLEHLRELSRKARQLGLKALTMEPMSCLAEPPTTPAEIAHYCRVMAEDHAAHPDETIPTYLCGDISHGLCDPNQKVVHSHIDCFLAGLPHMCEFHFKNTDAIYQSTFGFNPEEQERGVINLREFRDLCLHHDDQWPVEEVVGYLEIGGPKVGRDYTDPLLETELRASLKALKEQFFRP